MIIYSSNDSKIPKNYCLFLDDIRFPNDVTWINLPKLNWVIVRSYKEFVDCITLHGIPVHCSFDHDLSLEHYPSIGEGGTINKTEIPYDNYKEKTGYHCVQWLINYCLNNNLTLPKWSVHSMNSVGKQNIIQLLRRFEETR